MPPNKRIHKKTLNLECEWGACEGSFSRMEELCQHAENHLGAEDRPGGSPGEAGEELSTLNDSSWSSDHSALIWMLSLT